MKPRRKKRLLAGCAGVALIVGSLTGWRIHLEQQALAEVAADCMSTQCESVGRCTARATKRGLLSTSYTCAPGSRQDCERATSCRKYGECSLVDDDCAVGSDEDCRQSDRCREGGRCTWSRDPGEACISGSDADCRQSRACKEAALCTADAGRCTWTIRDGVVVPAPDG